MTAAVAVLPFDHIGSLGTARAFDDIELNVLTFVKGFEAVALNSGKMHEHVLAAVSFNKAKPLFSIKPFDFAVHVEPPKKNFAC